MASISRTSKGTPRWIKFCGRFKTWKSLVHYKWDVIIVDYMPGVSCENTMSLPMIDIVFITAHKGYRLMQNYCVTSRHTHDCLVSEDTMHSITLTAIPLDCTKFWNSHSSIATRCKTIPDVIELMKQFITIESL